MRSQLDITLYFLKLTLLFSLILTFVVQYGAGSPLPDEITPVMENSETSSSYYYWQQSETDGNGQFSTTTYSQGVPVHDVNKKYIAKTYSQPVPVHPGATGHPRLPKQPPRIQHTGAGSHVGGPRRDSDGWLAAHNTVRSLYGTVNLTWSDTLARAAKRTTDTCVWAHTKNDIYGENIAAGQDNAAKVVNDWVSGRNEKDSYDPKNPNYSHFTQVVWKGSTQVGCALTSCNSMEGISLPQPKILFWACEYHPAGNVMGEFNKNVIARKGGLPL